MSEEVKAFVRQGRDMVDRAQAMQAGGVAFHEGKSLNDCPYTDPELAAAWRTGMTHESRDAVAKSIAKVTALRRMPKH